PESHRPGSQLLLVPSGSPRFPRAGEVSRAEGLFGSMQKATLQMDVVSYGTLILAFARAGDGQGAVRTLRRCAEERIAPNVVCYGTAIQALRKEGNAMAAEALLQEMSDRRLQLKT
ncbi:unnamed protein product, partial [Cladocopium goreaui]